MSRWDDPVDLRKFTALEERVEELERRHGIFTPESLGEELQKKLTCQERVELAKKLLVGTSDEGRIK